MKLYQTLGRGELMTTDLMSEREVAGILRVTVQCLQKWRLEKKGPEYIKLGKRVRYDPAALERFIDERRVKPGGLS